MQEQTFKTLFLIRENRLLKNKKASLRIRLTVNGERLEWNTGVVITPDLWNKTAQRMVGRTREAEEANRKINAVNKRLNEAFTELLESGDEVTVDNLYSYYSKEEQSGGKVYSILGLYDKKIEEKQKLVGTKTGIKTSTLKKYIFTRNKMEMFLYEWKKQTTGATKASLKDSISAISIRSVNYEFIKEYELFLKSRCNCGHNTAMKHLWYLKQIVEDAFKSKVIHNDPFRYMQLPYKKVDREFLEEHEIKMLISKYFDIKRLDQVRDVFLFCCYTGLSYSDVANLSESHIFEDAAGKRWIKINRQKTNIESIIPLFDIPEMILKKYENRSFTPSSLKELCERKRPLLPVCSNQKMNAYLKEISSLCQINKTLTTHCARHTFATYCILIGISIESISRMLGHTNIKTTQIYARITRAKVDKEMLKVKDELNKYTVLYSQS